MLQSVEFENFKGVVQGKVDLAQFTILIGRNNSGKSTVLEAVSLLPNPFRLSATRNQDHIREILRRHDSYNALPLLNYYVASESRIHYVFSDKEESVLIMRNKKGENIVEFLTSRGGRELRVGSIAHNGGGGANPELQIKEGVKPLLIAPFLYTQTLEWIKNEWIDLANLGIPKHVVTSLSKQTNEEYMDLVIEPFKKSGGDQTYEIFFYLSDGKRVRVRDAGDGIQELLVGMMLVKKEDPNIIMWDDFESHMHPSLLEFALNWLKSLAIEGKQVIIATHNLDVINTAVELLDDFRSFAVKFVLLKDGKLSYKDLTPEDVRKLGDANVDVRLADVML